MEKNVKKTAKELVVADERLFVNEISLRAQFEELVYKMVTSKEDRKIVLETGLRALAGKEVGLCD